jgi:uncharacterized protein YeaO (DUF488 family)
MNTIKIKRVYEPFSEEDGFRILVDGLWPRGISKERANINEWAKYIAPSTELRKEFHQNPSQVEEFWNKYIIELDNNENALEFTHKIREKLEHGTVTFLYASKNEEMNHAVILKQWLEKR